MPEKIKEIRLKNEESFKYADDSFNQTNTGTIHMMGGNMNIAGGGGAGTYYQNNLSYTNHQSFYHHKIQTGLSTAENQNHDFEDFLNLIGEFYSKDPLKLELSLNYWIADNETNFNSEIVSQKPSQKQICLYKFVRYFLSGDTLISCLYVAYINMLTGLCTGDESAQHCFILLQNNSHFYDSYGTKISWNHIFYAFERYLESFKTDQFQNQLNMHQHAYNYNQLRNTPGISNKGITQSELQALISVIRLVNQIALHSEKARIALCEFQRSESGNNSNMNNYGLNNMTEATNNQTLSVIMFGLIGCSIPVSLKGEIFKLVGSLSLTPLIATNMWQLLENSQIIPTIISQSSNSGVFSNQLNKAIDIKVELEEIESRDETYPLLRGFLYFMKNLILKSKIPVNLGLGSRAANSILGFQPFLQFLVNNVYLKIFYRSYKNHFEKWELAQTILEIFYLLILKYDIDKQDFINQDQKSSGNLSMIQINNFKSPISNSPGYRLIYDLIHDGPIVRMLFLILNESLNHLLEYNSKNDDLIQNSALDCLKIISLVIEKQKNFIENMKLANLNIDCTGIEKLIVTLNPKTNKADYLMCILRFIQFNSSLIYHSHYSLNIIYLLSNYSLINSQFLNLFLKSCLSIEEQCELTKSFVDFVEYDEFDENVTKDDDLFLESSLIDESMNGYENNIKELSIEEIRSQNRLKSLKFLLFYLKMSAPNISHLLFGFNIHKSLTNQMFYNPGTKIEASKEILTIVPRNCLHSVIGIIMKFLKNPEIILNSASTIDHCYEILFILCSNTQFNQELLNYLRSEYDFFNLNLKKIPFKFNLHNKKTPSTFISNDITQNFGQEDEAIDMTLEANDLQETTPVSLYSEYSWIIKLVCLEIQSLISHHMKGKLKKLIQLLVESTNESDANISHGMGFGVNSSINNPNSNFSSLIFSASANVSSGLFNSNQNKSLFANESKRIDLPSSNDLIEKPSKLNSLLGNSAFSQMPPNMLNLNFFDEQLIEKVIESCKYNSSEFYSYLAGNLQLYDLKKIKLILLNEIKNSGIQNIPKTNLLLEVESILKNVHRRNKFQLNFLFKNKFLDSFKTLVDTLVMLTPTDSGLFSPNQRYKFLLSLINRLFDAIKNETYLLTSLTYPISSILFTLFSNLRQVISQIKKQQLFSESLGLNQKQKQQTTLNSTDLFDLFKKIINYLLNSSLSNLKVRTHLYATMLDYLMIFDDSKSLEELSCLLNGDESQQRQQTANSQNIEFYENIQIISKNSNGLLKLICSDSCEGLSITTMMGLCLLTKLMEIDVSNNWLNFISNKGYISCIINTILNTDNQLLEECFHSQIKNDKILYVFETKIAFLITISKSNTGSKCLLKNGLMNALTSASIYAIRIKFDRNLYQRNQNNQLLQQLLHQFYQIFFPTLDLCISILNSMGCDNIEAKSQIAKLVLYHSDTFTHVLTSRCMDIKMLEELKLVTCLLGKLAPFDQLKFETLSPQYSIEYSSIFSRIQKEMLNLLGTFLASDQLKQIKKEIEMGQISSLGTNATNFNKDAFKRTLNSYCVEIASNVCSFCLNIMKPNQYNTALTIFSPNIEAAHLHPYSPTKSRLDSKNLKLGLLVDFLLYSIENLEKSYELELDTLSKCENLNDLSTIEKKQIIGDLKMYDKMTENEKQFCLKQQINLTLKSTKQLTKSYISIIEKSLLILWRHIEFYLINMDNNDQIINLLDSFANQNKSNQNFQMSKEEYSKFRQNLILSLNSNFLKRFSIIDQKIQSSAKNDNFINVLVKRIERVIHLNNSYNF